ncbi:MAG: DnaB-like helicase N-terminal domain-containing protein, partial [Burkholderiaceae bacterium]
MSATIAQIGSLHAADYRDDDVTRLRVPPHSIEAEQSVLGGLLLDNSAWDRAADLLSDGDFYRYEHRLIYGAIGTLVQAN